MGAHNELTIEGLTELRAALRKLPQELAEEAGSVVLGAAQAAAAEMAGQYANHVYTGNLARGLSVTNEPGALRYGIRAVVRNRAPHAWWAEHGTVVRKNYTRKQANRGAMPPLEPNGIFIPIAQRHRRDMVRALIAIVERHGLVVTGTAD
jgi:hypothetical protein